VKKDIIMVDHMLDLREKQVLLVREVLLVRKVLRENEGIKVL
jgi:hypothetical protein